MIVDEIANERKRQINELGWSYEHDSIHEKGELALVAALYATPIQLFKKEKLAEGILFNDPWPWNYCYDKRKLRNRRELLIKAGALIIAEIERLDNV